LQAEQTQSSTNEIDHGDSDSAIACCLLPCDETTHRAAEQRAEQRRLFEKSLA
jgi:hypothetical protein